MMGKWKDVIWLIMATMSLLYKDTENICHNDSSLSLSDEQSGRKIIQEG